MKLYPVSIDKLFFEFSLIADKWLDHERSFLLTCWINPSVFAKMSKNQENVLREGDRRAPYGEGMKCSLNVWQTKSYLYYTRIALECVALVGCLVTLSRSEGSVWMGVEMLRCAQHDSVG